MLVDLVSASANATPGLGRYPPFKKEVKILCGNSYVTWFVF